MARAEGRVRDGRVPYACHLCLEDHRGQLSGRLRLCTTAKATLALNPRTQTTN